MSTLGRSMFILLRMYTNITKHETTFLSVFVFLDFFPSDFLCGFITTWYFLWSLRLKMKSKFYIIVKIDLEENSSLNDMQQLVVQDGFRCVWYTKHGYYTHAIFFGFGFGKFQVFPVIFHILGSPCASNAKG